MPEPQREKPHRVLHAQPVGNQLVTTTTFSQSPKAKTGLQLTFKLQRHSCPFCNFSVTGP